MCLQLEKKGVNNIGTNEWPNYVFKNKCVPNYFLKKEAINAATKRRSK